MTISTDDSRGGAYFLLAHLENQPISQRARTITKKTRRSRLDYMFKTEEKEEEQRKVLDEEVGSPKSFIESSKERDNTKKYHCVTQYQL